MAVQQNKKSPSKRGNRRSHDFLVAVSLSRDDSGEWHLPHHISPKGRYKGKLIVKRKKD